MSTLPYCSYRRLAVLALPLALYAALTALPTVQSTPTVPQDKSKLTVKPGDRIAIIGNTTADRLQYDGWLETYIQSRFPKNDLVFRNLGFSGDEVTLRLRSANFGSPDSWLTKTKADVIFAFFGYNESYAGSPGLDKFKKDLDGFVKDTLSKKYNGTSAPRLVLFSPIAHENLKNPNLPDGIENNRRIELYTAAMADVAKANNVVFVDLYRPTLELYGQARQALTINGVHLSADGNKALAQIIDQELFRGPPPPDPRALEKLRQAILDRNFYWFNRYRTVDGYSIFGGRADLKFVGGQTNRVVAQREMEILDIMTANRDKRIWAVAQGRDLKVDDSNTPDFIPVVTNKPGSLPGGKHLILDAEAAIKKMTVAKGMKVNLFASEKDFPELINPVQMTWDTKGRLWVAVWPTYPHWKPKEEMNDKILILEDTDGDGKADKCTVFADKLHCPTGFELWNGGVIVAQQPNIMFLKDTKGTGKADLRVRILHGMDSADTHHASNSFVLDPGGALYWQEGTFHHTQVESPWAPTTRCVNAGVFRYEPRTNKFDVYVAFGFANPHGHVFDRWGQDIVIDGTGANPYHAALFSGHLPYPMRHARPPQVYQQKTRPCPGMEYLSSKHFPDENQGNLLVANVIGFQGILQYKILDKGSSFQGVEVEPILSSTDLNFRPSDLRIGPDGAIYFLDWHNPIIGHMQHNLRDPSRGREHGRIYRVTYEGRPLSRSPQIDGVPVEQLLNVLKHPEDRVRYRTRIELGGRNTEHVLAATRQWLTNLDPKDQQYEHHMLEGLWLHQNHNVVNVELLKRMLTSPEFRARAAATRVLCYWRDRVPDALELLKRQAADKHPRVRLEAVRAASFFQQAEAVEVVLISAEKEADEYLEFTRGETMKALNPYVKKALAEGKQINFTSLAGARFFLQNATTEELLKMKRSKAVDLEILTRPGVREEYRKAALTDLAKSENKTEPAVLVETLLYLDEHSRSQDEGTLFDLVRMLMDRGPKQLATIRGALENLTTAGKMPVTRQLGYVALIATDGSADKAWALGLKSPTALRDLVLAVPFLRDPGQRSALYPKVEPLLRGLPKELAVKNNDKALRGRYVRIELPGKKKTLTLAEVEVYSDGRNVARQGKAKQSSSASGGDASRAIDGNKSGVYNDGGQTHTKENETSPWWEVDLGKEFNVNSIVIYNRTDGNLGKRLDGYTLKVLNANRETVFERKKQPAPVTKSAFDISGEAPEVVVRHAAMLALTSVRGQEAAAFKALTPFVNQEVDRHAAILALQRIPAKFRPKEEIKPLLKNVLTFVRSIPVKERTSPEALDALQLADSLAGNLPLNDARLIRQELGELGVRVIRMGTVPDQMRFDKDRIVVKAGKQVEIIFDNTDLMPHNLVVTVPGALEEVGNLAEATGTEPGAMARHYVPVSKKVLFATKMLAPRDTQKLSFVAPKTPGVYPYVCTYPGHWRRMYGAMYVVADLDEYLANPEVYLAKNPLPAKDELLKFSRPRTEWKYEDLAASVAKMDSGRSFSNGKLMFQVANCVGCHKLNGVGQEIGPDLTKLDPKQKKPLEVLKDVLEPSFRINEKYQSWVFETNDGKFITGMVVKDTPKEVHILENPLAKASPTILKVDDIASKKKSLVSIMPKGQLDQLTHDEILDLLAYVIAGANPNHPLFLGGHEHGEKKEKKGGHGH